jgi:predicted DNA-binding transcriptional regulator AlpA
MSSNTPQSVPTPSTNCRSNVSLSKWVNEPPLPWTELLSPREAARLTHRHHWMLRLLSLVGQFPQVQRFRGRPIGWWRKDVEHWLSNQPTEVSMDALPRSTWELTSPRCQHRRAMRCSTVGRESGRNQRVRGSASSEAEQQLELRP